jgi:hypothetical protein
VKEEIWYDMHKLDFPRKLVNLCKVLNKEVYAVVKIGKQITEDFKLSKGLRQRDTISPLLFNTVLEIAIQRSNIGTREPYLINVVRLWHMLMTLSLWEEGYRM